MRAPVSCLILLSFSIPLSAQNVIPTCHCDPSAPETMQRRECSLAGVANRQPPDETIFFVRDINPRKPNRTLALPRHTAGAYTLDKLPPELRTALWTAAIEKARSLWGEDWAVAYNGDKVRTQCHVHLHIGKLNSAAKLEQFREISHPREIPNPEGHGIWIYQAGRKLRVHEGEQTTETALLR